MISRRRPSQTSRAVSTMCWRVSASRPQLNCSTAERIIVSSFLILTTTVPLASIGTASAVRVPCMFTSKLMFSSVT